MPQAFKSVYYPDFPSDTHSKRSITLAFGTGDQSIFHAVKSLSSHELRQMIGFSSWKELNDAAENAGLTVNRLCVRMLRMAVRPDVEADGQAVLPGFKPVAVTIDPLQSTYRGGADEPLHEWYPYLEAYSSQFVARVIEEFAPDAKSILDPFGGLGTTPITAARMGRHAYYCELNPVLQFIADVKLATLAIPEKSRWSLRSELLDLSERFEERLAQNRPDESLRATYSKCFGDSEFFEPTALDLVLRARALVDEVACASLEVANLLLVAVLASLIPASRLIRRGDVRFQTPAESKRYRVPFASTVSDRLRLMAKDLVRLPALGVRPELLVGNARQLGLIPPLTVDALLTSPPYLNGTNYFRNTKIELWFLRCLLDATDLARFRQQAVTAGINDVTIGKSRDECLPETVEETVNQVKASAYDPRIPLMVRSYFLDMRQILRAAGAHLSASAPLLIDIGDSSYGGVHVRTPQLLADMLAEDGYELVREVTLRKRMSRSGFALSQVLLVLRRPSSGKRGTAASLPRESLRRGVLWASFKSQLPHQQGEFAKRNWGHPLHSLCSYQGKMKPSLASHLVKTFVPAGGTLLDPFGGVGTIPFEAALAGIKTFSFDISPAALHISNAKLGRPVRDESERTIQALDDFIQASGPNKEDAAGIDKIKFNGPLRDYFHPRTFDEVIAARRFFASNMPSSPSGSLVLASLLHILHGNRPYALSRRSHPITPFSPTGSSEYRALIPRLREKVERSLNSELPTTFVPGKVMRQDAAAWWAPSVCDLDAIITSPPFFDSTRFYLANWMRLWFCGWDAEDFRTKPLAFVDERQKRDLGVYRPLFRQARERLKRGGVFVMHLGKSSKCDMAKELAVMAAPWFRVADVFSESVEHCESHGIRDKGTVSEHAYLVLD
jgi:DNA modification methylase